MPTLLFLLLKINMRKQKPITLNALMKHLRNEKKIQIQGSKGKLFLLNYGYYHGYKGYRFRFSNNGNRQFTFDNIKQIQAVISFDSSLKELFYPRLMFIETAVRNRCLVEILSSSNSVEFNDIYSSLFINPSSVKDCQHAVQEKMRIRNNIYQEINNSYNSHNPIVCHFYDRNQSLPFWSIVELLTMGELSHLFSNLDKSIRQKISSSLDINPALDTDFRALRDMLDILRELRNAVAHNNIIFDTRFGTGKVKKSISLILKKDTGICFIDFSQILDYIILVLYFMKHLSVSKTEMKTFVREYSNILAKYQSTASQAVFAVTFDSRNKSAIQLMNDYISRG
jgi:abortive infection bacteriophage resistance protein